MVPTLQPSLVLMKGWKRGTRVQEPLTAFLHSMWGWVSPSHVNLLLIVVMFIVQVLQQNVKFYCPSCIPPGNILLTTDYVCLVSMAVSSAKAESNVETAERRNLSSTFALHHCPVQPLVILHGKVNLKKNGISY